MVVPPTSNPVHHHHHRLRSLPPPTAVRSLLIDTMQSHCCNDTSLMIFVSCAACRVTAVSATVFACQDSGATCCSLSSTARRPYLLQGQLPPKSTAPSAFCPPIVHFVSSWILRKAGLHTIQQLLTIIVLAHEPARNGVALTLSSPSRRPHHM